MSHPPKSAVCALLLFSLLSVVSGCGGEAPPAADTAASTKASADAAPLGSGDTRSKTEAQAAAETPDNVLASSACKALPLSAAKSFDSRLTGHAGGSGDASLNICDYNTPAEEEPSVQLILELVPSPAEPSESAARKICHELIEEIKSDPNYNYESSEAVPALGEESNVASGFVKADSSLDQDETTYVADWREDGSCARLIFASSGSGPVEPLSKFVALAESVSTSGSSLEQASAESPATEAETPTAATGLPKAPDPCSYFSDSTIERISGESVERHVHGIDYTLPSECDWVSSETGTAVAIMTIDEVPGNASNPIWAMFREEGGEPISPPCGEGTGYALPNPIKQQLRCGVDDWEVDLDIPTSRGKALSMIREVLSTLPS